MFEMFKATISKFKNSDENLENEEIKNEEIKALNSIVALLVEAASIDGNIGLDEKNQIKTILTDQLNIKAIKADEILEETISNSSEQIEIWSKTNDIRKELDYEERLNILELMWEIVLVDDIIDVFEAQLMRRVSGLLYISDIDSGNSKKRAIQKIKKD